MFFLSEEANEEGNLRFSLVRSITKNLLEAIECSSFREQASHNHILSSATTLGKKHRDHLQNLLLGSRLSFCFVRIS